MRSQLCYEMPDAEEKVKITVFVRPWVRTALKRFLAPTTKTQSQYVSEVLEAALIEEGYGPPAQDYINLGDLVEANYDLLATDTDIPKRILNQLVEGKVPDLVTTLRIALALDMKESDIKKLAEKQERKEDVANGV